MLIITYNLEKYSQEEIQILYNYIKDTTGDDVLFLPSDYTVLTECDKSYLEFYRDKLNEILNEKKQR